MLIRQESITSKMALKDLPPASPLPNANLVLVFGSVKRFSEPKLQNFLKSRYPAAQIIGCTTSGEIYTGGVLDDSLQITAILWEKTIQRVAHTKMSGMQSSFETAAGHPSSNAMLLTDAFIGFALGLLSATRLEIYLRARRLLESA